MRPLLNALLLVVCTGLILVAPTQAQDNTPPVAQDDAYELNEGDTLVVAVPEGVLANDTDAEGDPMTAVLDAPPGEGTLMLNADGSFSYLPEMHDHSVEAALPEAHDPTTFTYQACDALACSPAATVSITTNCALELGMIDDQVAREGRPLGPLDFTVKPGHAMVTGSADDPLMVPPENIVLDGHGRNRTVTITPAVGYTGTTLITLTADDGMGMTYTSFELTVIPLGTPWISALGAQVTHVDTPIGPVPFTLRDDGHADQLVLEVRSNVPSLIPQEGLEMQGQGAYRTLTITPRQGATGQARIRLVARDADGYKYDVSFPVWVLDEGAPVAVIDAYVVEADSLVVSAPEGLLANDWDPEGDALSVSLLEPPTEGTVTLNGDGSFVYIGGHSDHHGVEHEDDEPAPSRVTFVYQVSDGILGSNPGIVKLLVYEDETVQLSDIDDQVVEVNTVVGPLDFTVTPGHVTPMATSDNLALLPEDGIAIEGKGRNRTLTLTPTPDLTGEAWVTLTATDGETADTTRFLLTIVAASKSQAGVSLADEPVVFPNPFNPTTQLRWRVEAAGPMQVQVYDLLGRVMATLYQGEAQPGVTYQATIDGRTWASGFYVVRIAGPQAVSTHLISLVK